MGNKLSELACLNLAIEQCMKQRGVSKKIGHLLSGNDVVRDDDERPDFLRLTSINGQQHETLIGIEHFRVDHYSEKKSRQRVSSKAILYEKNVRSTFETWKPEMHEDADVPSGALVDIGVLLAQAMEQRIQATYHSFIESFKYSLNKHIQSIDYYHTVLDKYAGANEKKLAFLIEIHSDFSMLFFHDRKGTHHDSFVCPLFEELVQIMESIDARRVHYLILCFGGTIYNANTRVIAIPTKNLRKQLERQHIPVYHYAGHDLYLQGFQTPRLDMKTQSTYAQDGDNFTFHIRVASRDIKGEKKLEMVVGAYKLIQEIKAKKQYYATTNIVEMFCDVWGDFCSGIANESEEDIMAALPFITKINFEAIDANYAKHKRTWNIGEYNDQ